MNEHDVRSTLLALNIDKLSPLEALTKLYELKRLAEAEQREEDKRTAPSAPEAQPIADFEVWAVHDEFHHRYFSLRSPSIENRRRFNAFSSEDGKRVRVVVYALTENESAK